MHDDGSSSSDSSDDSDHSSSLHFSSGPIMGGRSPGQLDWMNKFTKTKPLVQVPGPTEAISSVDKAREVPEQRHITPTSSFSRRDAASTVDQPPTQPEWMNKFQTKKNGQETNNNGGSYRERSPSPTRDSIQSRVVPLSAPKTPSWMKQYQKGPTGAGAPMMPLMPSLASAPAPAPATPLPSAPSLPVQAKSEKKSSKKDWKALLNTSKAKEPIVTAAPAPTAVVVVEKAQPSPVAPPTPQWMNRFSAAGKGFPMAPKMDADDDSEDDQSVTSVNTTVSIEPEWMSQFNKIKSGTLEPKKIQPPSTKGTKSEEPEWIQKFQKHTNTNPSPTTSADTVTNSKTSNEEPEWMTRFREIGVHDAHESPVRSKPKSSVQSSSPFSGKHAGSNLLGKVGNSSFSGGFFLPPTASPDSKSGRLTMSSKFLGGGPSGMLSAPASPTSSGKMIIRGGGISAPSSPVGGAGSALLSAVFAMTPGPPAVLRQRSEDPHKVQPKIIDPAAMAPEKPAWMNKVKAVTHSRKEEPEWMVKLKLRKQGIHERGPKKGTPPWKVKERLKAEQTQRLKEELSLSHSLLDHSERHDDSIATGDHLLHDSRLDNHHHEDGEDDPDDEHIPEWMRQFKKMHLKEAEVLSYAQGRAPQGVSRLRRGSTQMIERNDKYNPANEAVRATPTVLKLPKKMSKRDTYGPKLDDSISSDLDKSIGQIDTSTHHKDEAAIEMEKSLRVLKYVQEAQSQQTSTTSRGPLPKKSSHDSLPNSAESTTKEGNSNNEPKPNLSSDLHTKYNEQVEIDNTKPENVMSMWGKTVKAKKPGNATLMSFRMIQNQADLVKDRIARAKQKAEDAESAAVDSDEESIKDVEEIHIGSKVGMDNSAAALFGVTGTAGTAKRESIALDNSAAALFGFGGGKVDTNKRESASMDNSAAALFGFGNAHDSSNSISVDHATESSKTLTLDNSAAAMFGFGATTKASDNHSAGDNSVSMDNSAAALFGISGAADEKSEQDHPPPRHAEPAWAKGKSIAEEDSSDDDSSTDRNKNKTSSTSTQKETEPKSQLETKQKSFLDDSSSDESSSAARKKKSQPIKANLATEKKKSFLDESDSDDSSDDDKPKSTAKSYVKKTSSKSDSDSEDEKSKTVQSSFVKKSSLDDSGSDDSSDDEKRKGPLKPLPISKKSSLADSDSDDSDEDNKPKKSASPIPVPVKKTFLDDSDSDSDDEKPKNPPKVSPAPPSTKPSLHDSDSEDSSDDQKPKAPSKAQVPAATKKSFLDESDSDDSDKDQVKTTTVPASKLSLDDSDSESDGSAKEKPKVSGQTPNTTKKSFLDDSDSEDSIDGERPKLVPIRLSTPAFAETPSPKKSSQDDSSSSSDDSSTDKKGKTSSTEEQSFPAVKSALESKTDSTPSTFSPNAAFSELDPSEEEKKGQDEKQAETANDGWGETFDAGAKTVTDEDAEWQAALLELAAEEQAKKEKAEQDAWQAALEELATQESRKKDDKDAWDAALKDLEAEEEKQETKEKIPEKVTKTKNKDTDKKKTKEIDKTAGKDTKKKSKDSETDADSKKKSKKVDKNSDIKVGKDSKTKKLVAKVKEKKDRSFSKSPKTKKATVAVVKESKKKGNGVSTFDSSPFGGSPFGASPFDDPSPFAPLAQSDPSPFAPLAQSDPSPFAPLAQSDPSPFAPIPKMDVSSKSAPVGTSHDASPFAPLDNSSPFGPLGGTDLASPFAPLDMNDNASPFAPLSETDKNSPFAPLGGKAVVDEGSPFARLDSSDGMDKASPFAPLNENEKKKKNKKGLTVKNSGKTKPPKSSLKLVVQTAKVKGDLHQKRAKKKSGKDDRGFDENDDDSFGNMDDFDDNFSVKNDFGDFAEDGSVVPLRAIRNAAPKAKMGTFAPKPPLHANTKVKPNLLIKKVKNVDDSKDSKTKEKDKEKSRSRSKSVSKRSSRSRSKSAEKGKSRSRSKSADKEKARSRSKSASARKTQSTSASGDKKKESRGRSKPPKKKGTDDGFFDF